jgi:hypothetical protein
MVRFLRLEVALLVLFVWGLLHLSRSYQSSAPSEQHAAVSEFHLRLVDV